MYCVIQKIKNKMQNQNGTPKELKIVEYNWSLKDGAPKVHYGYEYGTERFERPILDAYKISIHKSYREDGKVKKKQWSICTIGYYQLAYDFTWIKDYVSSNELEKKLKSMKIKENKFLDITWKKLVPIIKKIKKEFKATPEYKVRKKQDKILYKYIEDKSRFESRYGSNTYDSCYDVLGVLRNKDYLETVKNEYKERYSYYKYNGSYYEKNYSDYKEQNSNYNSYNSYQPPNEINYTDEDKEKLKKFYKVLALKFHPDIAKDDGEMMKLVNRLKEDWGI